MNPIKESKYPSVIPYNVKYLIMQKEKERKTMKVKSLEKINPVKESKYPLVIPYNVK